MAKYKAGVRFRFEIEFNDGTNVVVVNDLRDVLQWERNHNGRSFVKEEPSIDQLLWLAWAKMRRSGQTDLRYEQWADTIEDFNPDQADKPGTETDDQGEPVSEPVPTNEAVGVGG